MPYLITTLIRSANKNITRKKNKQKSKIRNLTAKTQYLNFKAIGKQHQNAIR